jgi:hypothetical protein
MKGRILGKHPAAEPVSFVVFTSTYTGVDRHVQLLAEQLKRPEWPVLHGDP